MNVASRNPKLVCGCDLTAPVTCYKSIEMFRSFQYAHINKPWRAFLTEKSHWIHMWPTCVPHVFPCGTHVLFQFHMFPHMWGKFSTCETHGRPCKHMCISCDPQVTHMSPHVVICEARVGSHLLALRSHVKKNMWNWNNTRNSHVNFMWYFCRVIALFDVFS